MNRPYALVVLAVLASLSLQAGAAPRCSIHPRAGLSDAELNGLAEISRAAAEKIALRRLNAPAGAAVSSAELEAEHGCLIWSLDVRIAGKAGIEEVHIDAGNGTVLAIEHEATP